jgi:hypothetical protein
LEEVKRQFGELPTTQSAAQQNGEERSVALAFEGLDPGRLPKTASLLRRQPVSQPDAQFLRSFDTTNARGELGAEQPRIRGFVSEPADRCQSDVDRPRRK